MKKFGVMWLAGMLGLIVTGVAARAVAEGFLLPEDAADLISLAEASHVLR